MLAALQRKTNTDSQSVTEAVKSGLEALDKLCKERDAAQTEVYNQRLVIDRLTLEVEGLRNANIELTNQRDFWMRVHAKLESNLTQLGAIMQTMWAEFHGGTRPANPQQMNDETKKLAQRLAPEGKNAKSMG